LQTSGASRREIAESHLDVIARSVATKQSILSWRGEMDYFAEPVIGRRFAPTRWLAMTADRRERATLPVVITRESG
jgi:hypothetical protein